MNQQFIDQYLAGKLNETEAEAFEEYCLENPEFARQVELEQRLKAGLAQVSRGSTAEFVRSGHERRWRLALAASVLLFVCAGAWLWQHSAGVRPQILAAMTSDTVHDGPSLRLALVRGAENVPVLPRGQVRVEIVGLFDMSSEYRVLLDRLQSGKDPETVAAIYGQHPSTAVTLEVLLDGDQLAPGAYSLHVARKDSHDDPLDFGFVKP